MLRNRLNGWLDAVSLTCHTPHGEELDCRKGTIPRVVSRDWETRNRVVSRDWETRNRLCDLSGIPMEWETLRLSMDGSDGWTDHPCQCRMPNLPLCVGPAYRNRKLTE